MLLSFFYISFYHRISAFSIFLFLSPLYIWPHDLPISLHTHTSLIQEMKMECRGKEEKAQQVVLTLEEEQRGLTSCCATLQADLEEKERQANSQRDERNAAQARLKVLGRGQVLSETHPHTKLYRDSPILCDASYPLYLNV